MKGKCAKCGDKPSGGGVFIEGGVNYVFCPACSDVVRALPTGSIAGFMGPKNESWVEKNMRTARERRARGDKLWEWENKE